MTYINQQSTSMVVKDFSTSFSRLPPGRFGKKNAVCEWQMEINHFKDGKERYNTEKERPHHAKHIPESAMGLYQKSFMCSWIVCLVDTQYNAESIFRLNQKET